MGLLLELLSQEGLVIRLPKGLPWKAGVFIGFLQGLSLTLQFHMGLPIMFPARFSTESCRGVAVEPHRLI